MILDCTLTDNLEGLFSKHIYKAYDHKAWADLQAHHAWGGYFAHGIHPATWVNFCKLPYQSLIINMRQGNAPNRQ